MSEGRLQPTGQRLLHMDVLRGFALLGILLVNFQWFVRPIQAIALGAEQRKAPFWGLYLRRLFLLMLFGLGHMLLVWAGDILLVYSLCGFFMVLLFRKTPARRLWKWALAFFLFAPLLIWLAALSIAATQFDPEIQASTMAQLEADETRMLEQVAVAQSLINEGSWRDNVGQRLRDAAFTLSHAMFWVPPIVGFFLLGRWLVVTERLTRPDEHRMFFRRWRSRGLLLGLPLSLAGTSLIHGASQFMPTINLALGFSLFSAGAILLALAYLSLVCLASERLRWLAPAGQMALSNYLCQSLFWTWMLYGHGLGLAPLFPRWSHLLLALAFFAVQLLISHWWMARFRFGPAEWLWRSLTYLRRQPMVRND